MSKKLDPKTLSAVATGGLAVCIVILVLKHWFFGQYIVPIAIQIFALLWMVWARMTMGMNSFHFAANPSDNAQLVTTGPYRIVRHPIYFAIFLATWAGVADHFMLLPVALAFFVTVLLGVRVYCEEKLLRVHFREYEAYQQATKAFIPFCY